MFTRLQWRIAGSYVLLAALVFLALGLYLTDLSRTQQLSSLENQLARQAKLVADNAQHHLISEGPASLDPLAKELGAQVGARITLIAPDGRVLGDSEHDPATMDNHLTRPEVAQALQAGLGHSQRHSATLERDLLYVAVPIQSNGVTMGVARVALPVTEVQEVIDRTVLAVAGALVLAAFLSIVLAILLARLLAARIQTLTAAVRRVAAGTLDQTIPVEGRDEVALLARGFNEMVARLRLHVQQVEDERGRLAAVLTHMADGAVIADAQGIVRLVNPVAARLLEVDPAQAQGRSAMAVVRNHELAELVRGALATPVAGPPHLFELGPPSHRRAVQALASPIPGEPGEGGRVLLILQDVTELRRVETVRREFVANVSHELRTPVAALKALVETLEEGALEEPDVARDFLGRMHVEVDGLAQLVEELLALASIESGRVALDLQTVDLGANVEAAVERLRPLAERQGVTLSLVKPDEPLAARADPDRIQQVLANLVHNAIKYTLPGGTVTVEATRRASEAEVRVVDTGVGIAPEQLGRLFERFYKADRARAGGGTGLGLAIAKHLVQVQGGRIWAESAGEGRGATFTFVLPLVDFP